MEKPEPLGLFIDQPSDELCIAKGILTISESQKSRTLCPWEQEDHTAPHPAGWQAGQCHQRGGLQPPSRSHLSARAGEREEGGCCFRERSDFLLLFLSCRTQQIKSPRTANQQLTRAEIPRGPELLQRQFLQSLVSHEYSCLPGGAALQSPFLWVQPPRWLEADTEALHSSWTGFGEYKALDITSNCRSFILGAMRDLHREELRMEKGWAWGTNGQKKETPRQGASERKVQATQTRWGTKEERLKGSWSMDTKLQKQKSHWDLCRSIKIERFEEEGRELKKLHRSREWEEHHYWYKRPKSGDCYG